MSIHAMSWAIKVKGLPIATKAVLMLLADCHNGETGQCNPSMRHLMELTGLKERALQIHLKTLEEASLINREYVFHGRGKGCSVDQYNLKIGILGAVEKPAMKAQDIAPAKECARKIRSMDPQNIAPPYKEEPEENRKIRGSAKETLENIWQAWSPEGRKRSKAKAKIEVQLTALAKHHPLQAIERAAIAFARDAKPEFHPALDRWLKDGKF
jgi:pyocin large subunit-like protein